MIESSNEAADREPVELHPERPHPARVYDYLLGGNTNFASDRAFAEAALKLNEGTRTTARSNREFLRRAVTFLTRDAGIRQFIDIGTGLPTSPNVHEIAHSIAPESRVVYTDNDPIVAAHARALLTSEPGTGPTTYIEADLRKPETILSQAHEILDFTQPIGLLLIAVTHHLKNDEDPQAVVAAVVDALPSGSYLALSQITDEFRPEQWHAIEADFARRGSVLTPRPRASIEQFFTGLEKVDPGLQVVNRWRPEESDAYKDLSEGECSLLGAVARKA
ncbi:SAM-dependent methyltransferase [Cryptosporangium phraense]|uniref:SAM-dependent methyltransferase n=2 Tax=Cryptosporangium phraense TaxID=2593070 RepID=A0A545AII6_9ACTN|nr:SAM-dependent methyltransferase [Cryptosporangium phraense]